MNVNPRALFIALLAIFILAGCGTDTKKIENFSESAGSSHYSGTYIDGNDNPANRAQYMGYSLKGVVNVGGTGNGTSPLPNYINVDFTISCLSCHPNNDVKANASILKDYALTGHADVSAIPWTVPEVGASCQRCHTTFGFLYHLENYDPTQNFSGITLSSPGYSTPWIGAVLSTPLNQLEEYRKSMQILTCSACHEEDSLTSGKLRSSPQSGGFVTTWSANSITSQVNYPDAGASNLCIRCHSSRRAGANITASGTTTAHYLPAAATLFSGTKDLVDTTINTTNPPIPPAVGTKFTGVGYEFLGQSYITPEPSHKNVGNPGGKGPCVGCHMGTSSGHSLKIFLKNENNDIVSVRNDACLGCHGTILPSWIENKRDGFHDALVELDKMLQSKGFYLNPEDGSFYRDASFSLPLGVGSTNAERTAAVNQYYNDQADSNSPALDYSSLRGSAFNLWLFNYKLGDTAAYVHNSNYTKKIIFDTIDYLDNGVFDGTITVSSLSAAEYLDGNTATNGIQRP